MFITQRRGVGWLRAWLVPGGTIVPWGAGDAAYRDRRLLTTRSGEGVGYGQGVGEEVDGYHLAVGEGPDLGLVHVDAAARGSGEGHVEPDGHEVPLTEDGLDLEGRHLHRPHGLHEGGHAL